VTDFVPVTDLRYSSCCPAAILRFESDAAAPFCDELVRLTEDFDFDLIQKLVLDLDN
jgi:hypothetical protein